MKFWLYHPVYQPHIPPALTCLCKASFDYISSIFGSFTDSVDFNAASDADHCRSFFLIDLVSFIFFVSTATSHYIHQFNLIQHRASPYTHTNSTSQ
mmetsp:Transcript_40571/g.85154  ORF Transcript_40571/g.85154 Transcript_40571/m.85154 type:complete len:96 (+) Transcript_40571:48-335(+)